MENSTEEIILKTARKHFVQNGYSGARMQEIADEAGINKAMLHYYFRSKDKLYHQIVCRILDRLMPAVSAALGAEGTFREKLERIVDTHLGILSKEPDYPIFIMSELSQKRERFINEVKKRSAHFPAARGFILSMQQEMMAGKIRQVPPFHLMLNIMSMTVFPFMSRPMFTTIFEFSDADFDELMKDRKKQVLDFIDQALLVR